MTVVRVPASSANLGPGFDALGLALGLYMEVSDAEPVVDAGHPAAVAHRAAGGDGRVAVSARFPAGRGLGFSAAARIGGALLALGERGSRSRALELAADLEGHADNAAAALYGGVTVAAAGRAVKVSVPAELVVVLWIPSTQTSTRSSRARLGPTVDRGDATFNIGRVALLVAALAAGDLESLRAATEDRLHQDERLGRVPESRDALEAMLRCDEIRAAWLSGSGPTVAGFAAAIDAEGVLARLPAGGRSQVVPIDLRGAVVET